MTHSTHDFHSFPKPSHVAVIGAAGGLGQGILDACRMAGIGFTAIVRSRPERIADVPTDSRVAVVDSLADHDGLASAFAGVDAVLTAVGVTSTSFERSALLSKNTAAIEASMSSAGVDRIVLINSIITSPPGRPANRITQFFSRLPGKIGGGISEQQAMADALAEGAFASLRWTLVRAGVNAKGRHERPVASTDWGSGQNSWLPVSYVAMGRWMLEEAVANRFIRVAPLVSRARV
jgi:nucleoside-diphosphate-sugar epimerase